MYGFRMLAVKCIAATKVARSSIAIIFMNWLPPNLLLHRIEIETTDKHKKGIVQSAIATPVKVMGLVDISEIKISIPAVGICSSLRRHGLLVITGRI